MRWAAGAVLLCAAAGVLFVGGCGEDEDSLSCEYCAYWDFLLDGYGRYPAYSPDPAHANRIAFSSRRPDTVSVVETDRYEHIWVAEDGSLFKISDADFNDFDVSWSPGGEYLAFTREMLGRLDIWVVDVSDPANPGIPVRLTSGSNVTAGASEPSWLEEGGELWVVFSSGGNVYRVHRSGGTALKLIPDPRDIGGRCELSEHEDFQPAVGPDGRIAFTSIGRMPVGTLEVSGFIEEGQGETEVYDADIYLDDCLTGLTTPHTFHYLPVKPGNLPYTVSVETPLYCDRRYMDASVRSNQTELARFDFAESKGSVFLWVDLANCDVYVIDADTTTFHTWLGVGLPQPDSTVLRCFDPGEHLIRVQWSVDVLVDTLWNVVAGQTDTVRINRPTGKWSGVFMSAGDRHDRVQPTPNQADYSQVWVADLEEHKLTGFWSLDSEYEQPCWSPDGRYVAFLASDPLRNRWSIRVADLEGSSVRSIPLPGASGSAGCTRSAYQLTWNATGDRLAASLGDCTGNELPQELRVWVVDPRPFLGK